MSYESRIPEIIAELNTGLKHAVHSAGLRFEAEAKSRARVATIATSGYVGGYMRRAIRWTPTGEMTGEVVGGADYTIYNEYGTVHMSAQPMFGPAAEVVRPLFTAECESVLVKVIGR